LITTPPAEPELSRSDKKFNFGIALLDAVGWPLGAAFLSQTTLLPLFLRHLGASNTLIGALPALYNLLVFLPGPLVVGYLGRRRRARGYLWWVALLERLAIVPLAVLTPLWAGPNPGWLLTALFLCIAFHSGMMGLNQPAYWVVIGKTIPPHWRGRLFGYAGGIAGVLGIGLDRVLNRILSGPDGGFPNGYALCFWIGFALMAISFLPLGIIREPSAPPAAPDDPHTGHYGRDSRRVWRENHGFRRFLYGQIMFFLATLATPFFVLEAGRRLHAGVGAVAGYTATLILVGSFGGLGWGAWSDRVGNKAVLVASAVCAAFAAVLAPLVPSASGFYSVFAALALATAGAGIAGNNMVMEYAGASRDIPLYTAMFNAVTALPRALAPLIGGLLADRLGSFHTVFALSAVFAVVSLLLTLRAQEPRLL
jgi:MFS family permease